MINRTRILTAALAAVALAGGGAGLAAAQASTHTLNPASQAVAPAQQQLTFGLQRTALRFFSNTGPIKGWPTKPLVTGDRVIGADLFLQHGKPVGHDDEACTVAFSRDVLCQDIIVLPGQGDVQVSWGFRWPASGPQGPANFNGVIDGGTGHFRAAHGWYHYQTLPNGHARITATFNGGS